MKKKYLNDFINIFFSLFTRSGRYLLTVVNSVKRNEIVQCDSCGISVHEAVMFTFVYIIYLFTVMTGMR